jgi:ABC-type sugar transport system permease subunit
MVAPALLVVVGIYLYPAILMLLFSMAEIDVATFSIKRLIGWQNYLTVITGPNFGPVMLRTIYFATVVALLTSLAAFPIALLLNQRFPGRGLVRVVVLLPWAIPPIVSGVMWGQIFHADFGLLNGILRLLGLPGETIWLGDATLALHALILVEVWRSLPLAVLFLLAALQTLPESIYEAAAIDGAGSLQSFRYLTMPLMLPLFMPILSFTFVVAMKAFDTIFVLTRGGPAMGTTTLNFLVYQQAFQQTRFGQAAASAYLLCLVTVGVFALLAFLRWRLTLRNER